MSFYILFDKASKQYKKKKKLMYIKTSKVKLILFLISAIFKVDIK